jgi:pimeloyl-ACP methyl ester carboxylesterase
MLRAHLAFFAALVSLTLASSGNALCRSVSAAVALAEGQPTHQQLAARLCEPSGASTTAGTLLVLVHGITYDRNYWDIPDPTGHTDRYSFVAAALKAKFSTLSVDRIGAGSSSHPLSALVTIDSNAYTVHQLIQAVRSGGIRRTGGRLFDTVVLVGHSYGSWTTWFEATRYDDVDAVVLTGATHGLTRSVPSSGDLPRGRRSRFSRSRARPGLSTTQPDTRYHAFYEPPRSIGGGHYDEMTKEPSRRPGDPDLSADSERSLDIRVPSIP